MKDWKNRIDHLAFATHDLEEGIQYIEKLLGVSIQPGGRHPAWGTHNVLIALGKDVFLEIIAPDPERPDPTLPPLFGIDKLKSPRLTAWAAREEDLGARLESLKTLGYEFGELLPGSRQKPDGTTLRWELSDPLTVVGDGVVPFLIDWGTTPHPAAAMPQECQLLDLYIEHPEVEEITGILNKLELFPVIQQGKEPALVAKIQTPRGEVILR